MKWWIVTSGGVSVSAKRHRTSAKADKFKKSPMVTPFTIRLNVRWLKIQVLEVMWNISKGYKHHDLFKIVTGFNDEYFFYRNVESYLDVNYSIFPWLNRQWQLYKHTRQCLSCCMIYYELTHAFSIIWNFNSIFE